MKKEHRKSKPEKIKTLSIQRRIYPDIVDAVETEADKQGITPTHLAAKHLRKQLKLEDK